MMRLFQTMISSVVILSVGIAGCSANPNDRASQPSSSIASPSAELEAESPDETIAAAPSPESSTPSGAADAPPDDRSRLSDQTPLALERVAIGNVQLGAPEAAVRQALGEPTRQTDEDWRCCGMVRTLEYGSETVVKLLEITEGQFQVFAVSTRDRNLTTADGIQLGDSRQTVLERYGTPDGTREEDGVTTLFYGAPVDYAAALWIRLEGDRVVEIGYDSQLT